MNMLSTQRLALRPRHPANSPAYRDFLGPDAAASVSGPCSATEIWTRFGAMTGHRTLSGFGWFTVENHDGPVGVTGIHHPPVHAEMELGRIVYPRAQRRGYAAEVAQSARDRASATLCPDRLFNYIGRADAASQGVTRRLGATTDGTRVLHDPECETWMHEGAA